MALWDILGKRAGMPVYQFFGGKCREAVRRTRTRRRHFAEVSQACAARDRSRLSPCARAGRRPRIGDLRLGRAVRNSRDCRRYAGKRRAQVWEPRNYVTMVPKLFEHLRKKVGDEVELLHDAHERVPPILAMQLAKDLEPYKLFFLEDPLSPEDVGYFEKLRPADDHAAGHGRVVQQPTTNGCPSSADRLIDFIRIHISPIGGLTPARKVAALCDFFAVRTAWHGPGDVSPVGHAANVHFDLATPQLRHPGGAGFTQTEQECSRAARNSRTATTGPTTSRAGHRHGREGRGEVPDPRRPAVRYELGQPAAARRVGHEAVIFEVACGLAYAR